MPRELIYTSAVSGLQSGTRGFCTVACTAGMSPMLVRSLETLSGYRRSTTSGENPVVYSHLEVNVTGMKEHIVSRIADAGLDYSGRTNMIAHHFVFKPEEWSKSDYGFLLHPLDQTTGFVQAWNESPQYFPVPRPVLTVPLPYARCGLWEKMTGDAGWGGVLAQTAETRRNACIIYRQESDHQLTSQGNVILPLILESLGLLPPMLRRDITFTTFYMKLPPGTSCQWKGIIAGSPEETFCRSIPNTVIIDLTHPLPKLPTENSNATFYMDAARTGIQKSRQVERPPLVVKMVPPANSEQREIPTSVPKYQPVEPLADRGTPGLNEEAREKIDQLSLYYEELGNQPAASKKHYVRTFIMFMVIMILLGTAGFVFKTEIMNFFSHPSTVKELASPGAGLNGDNVPETGDNVPPLDKE